MCQKGPLLGLPAFPGTTFAAIGQTPVSTKSNYFEATLRDFGETHIFWAASKSTGHVLAFAPLTSAPSKSKACGGPSAGEPRHRGDGRGPAVCTVAASGGN